MCAIWLLRHGDAENGDGDDAARRLTKKGETQSRNAGLAMAALDAGIQTCLASPRVRAHDTARLACEPLGLEVEVRAELSGGDFDLEALAAGRGETLLVGHEPDFSRAVALTTGARVEFKKGGIAVVENGVLLRLLRPADLRAIAAAGG